MLAQVREGFQIWQSIQKDPAIQVSHFMLDHVGKKSLDFQLHGLVLTVIAA